MIRQALIAVILLAVLFLLYAPFARRPAAVRWLLGAALVLVIAGFGLWVEVDGAPPGAAYVPAHMDHGQFVPGTFKYQTDK